MISLVFFFLLFSFSFGIARNSQGSFFASLHIFIDCQGPFFFFPFCLFTAMPSCPQHRHEHAATTRCTTAISTNPRNG